MPFNHEEIREEFNNHDTAWVLKDDTGKHVTVPHHNYHDRLLVPLFMGKADAERFLAAVLTENPALQRYVIAPREVLLFEEMAQIAASPPLGYALYSPNAAWDWYRDYKLSTASNKSEDR